MPRNAAVELFTSANLRLVILGKNHPSSHTLPKDGQVILWHLWHGAAEASLEVASLGISEPLTSPPAGTRECGLELVIARALGTRRSRCPANFLTCAGNFRRQPAGQRQWAAGAPDPALQLPEGAANESPVSREAS